MPETRQCAYCGADVTRPPSRFNGERTYCDKTCMAKDYDDRVELTCDECGATFKRSHYEVDKYDNHYCSNSCMYKRFTRENAPNWRGGHDNFSTSERGKEWRRAVFERDDYTCQDCGVHGSEAYLNAHHIKRRAEYPELEDDVDNGLTLCEECHAQRHEGETAYYLIKSNIRRRASDD